MTAEATARARRSKRVGRDAENRVAAIMGTARFPANVGGPIDLVPVDGVYVQVKAGATLPMSIILTGLDTARIGAGSHAGLGGVALEYHRGGRVRTLIAFDLREWCAWNGFGPKEDEQ